MGSLLVPSAGKGHLLACIIVAQRPARAIRGSLCSVPLMVVSLNFVPLRPLCRSDGDRLDALSAAGWLEVTVGV